MDRVDELNQEAIKFNRYQQQVIRQQQDKHRFLQKRVRLHPLEHALFGGMVVSPCISINIFTHLIYTRQFRKKLNTMFLSQTFNRNFFIKIY
jgi:hypothetical protein